MAAPYPKMAQWKSAQEFRQRLSELALDLPVDDKVLSADEGSPLAQPLRIGGTKVGNRWCIHPMEGWDANPDGSPSEWTLRRWRRFGQSGAKWIWGGEAAAVQPDGRANPHQTMAIPGNQRGLALMLRQLVETHETCFGTSEDLLVGLQLTHSGRFCRPRSKELEPRIAYHHPLLDKKFGIDPDDHQVVWTDTELLQLIDRFVEAAGIARDAGFQFVDIKSCHGYLLHEFLSARSRPGDFGGDFAGRTRLLKTIVSRVRDQYPDLMVMVRLGVFDMPPFVTSHKRGRPMDFENLLPYVVGFGVNPENPMEYDLTEPLRLIEELCDLGVAAINISAGSPYYNPHMQRPAIFPPSDGYQPPEDPLVGVVRLVRAARECKLAFPDLPMVGTGYSYLQDFLPQVAQAVVRAGWIDSVGLGRMVLSYPDLPADTLNGRAMARKQVCRTFSDCTTGPRNGMVSGCFPLDPDYRVLPEAARLREIKRSQESSVAERPE